LRKIQENSSLFVDNQFSDSNFGLNYRETCYIINNKNKYGNIHGKNAEVHKNLARYRFENNFVGLSK